MKLVMWSLPFANIIWDAQTSQMSSVFCKAFECFVSVQLFSWTLAVLSNLVMNRHGYRSAGIHAPSEAAFQHLHFHSSEMVKFEKVIAERSPCQYCRWRKQKHVCLSCKTKCVHLLGVGAFLFLSLQENVGLKLLPTFCLGRTGACCAPTGQ